MHHKNHSNSSENHNNPQHLKPKKSDYPTGPSPGGRYARPKTSVLSKIRDRFKDKPATKEEVEQLKLNAQREIAKTQIVKAKKARPSRFDFLTGGGQSSGGGRRSSRRSSDNSGSFLMDGGNSSGMGMFGSSDEGPSLNMFKCDSGKKSKKTKNREFGSGLEDLF